MKYLNKENVTIVFSSCERYKPIWDGFFLLFDRYFPKTDCNIYGTVKDNYIFKQYLVRGNNYSGDDTSFSTSLLKTLKRIKTKYILFFLDDFYITNYVQSDYVDNAIGLMIKNPKIKNIVLKDFLSTKAKCNVRYNDDFWVVKKKAPYKCTTQTGFFERKYLISLLRKGESAWDFEYIGTYRAQKRNVLLLYRDDKHHNKIPYFADGYLHRGRFNNAYYQFSKDNNLPIVNIAKDNKNETTVKNYNVLSRLLISFKRFVAIRYYNCYPFLSLVFPFFRKRKSFVPKKIKQINKFDNKYDMP